MLTVEERLIALERSDRLLGSRVVELLKTSPGVRSAVLDCLSPCEDEDPGPNILEDRVIAIEERLAQHPRYTTPGLDSMAFTLEEIERIRIVLMGGTRADHERLAGGN